MSKNNPNIAPSAYQKSNSKHLNRSMQVTNCLTLNNGKLLSRLTFFSRYCLLYTGTCISIKKSKEERKKNSGFCLKDKLPRGTTWQDDFPESLFQPHSISFHYSRAFFRDSIARLKGGPAFQNRNTDTELLFNSEILFIR